MKIAVYTCIIDGYDTLKEVVKPEPGIAYICFSNTKLKSKTWEVRRIGNPLGLDSSRLSRYPKIMPHLFLPEYNVSIYVDGSVRVLGGIHEFTRTALGDYNFCACKHPSRDCIYREATVVKKLKDSRDIVEAQMAKYQSEGMPAEYGLIAGGLLIRRHNDPVVMRISAQWWEEVMVHSKRDQLSLPYVAWLNPDFKYKLIDYHSTLCGRYFHKQSNHNEKYIY